MKTYPTLRSFDQNKRHRMRAASPRRSARSSFVAARFRALGRATQNASLAAVCGALLGCASLAGQPAVAASPAAPNYEATYLEAQLALASNDHDGAITLLKPLSEREDCPPEIELALSEAYVEGRDPETGLQVASEVVKKHPLFVPGWLARADLNRRKGEINEAILDLDKALALEPKNAELLEKAGLWRLQTTKSWDYREKENSPVGKVIDIYTRLKDLRDGVPRIMPLLVLSSVYTQIGRNDDAIAAAKEAVEIKPTDVRPQVALAEAYEAAQKKKDALDAYRQALLADPNNAQVRKKIIGLVSSIGSPGGVLAFYEDLAKSFPRIQEIQEACGDELMKAGEWSKASAHYSAALKEWPENVKFRANLVMALCRLGRDNDAIAAANAVLEDPEAPDQDLLVISETLRAAGKLDLVIDVLRRVAESKKDDARLHLRLANVQIEAKKPGDAMKTLERLADDLPALMQKRPDGFLVVATLGKLYTDDGNFEKAHKLYDRAQKGSDKSQTTDLLLMKANLFRQEKKNEEAVSILEGILEQSERAPETATQMLLSIYEAAQSYDALQAALDRFIAKAPTAMQSVEGKRLKAYYYWRAHEYDKAIGIMEPLQKANPKDMKLLQLLAQNYVDNEQFDEAMALVDAAGQPADGAAANELGVLKARIYRGQNKLGEAVAVVEGLVEENPELADNYLILGDYYQQSGRLPDAEKTLRRAMELEPTNAEAYNALGYFFAEAGHNLDEALRLVQKALEISPDEGHILDSLGWVYYKKGDYGKAVEALEKAVSQMSNAPDAVVLEHLGDAYAKAGNADAAKKSYREALKLNPKSGTIREKLGD